MEGRGGGGGGGGGGKKYHFVPVITRNEKRIPKIFRPTVHACVVPGQLIISYRRIWKFVSSRAIVYTVHRYVTIVATLWKTMETSIELLKSLI